MNPQIQILNKKQKKQIEKQAELQFGIQKLPYLLFKTNKGRIRGYSGNLSTEEIRTLLKTVNIEINGIYLFNTEEDGQLRISHDAVSLFRDKITKNIIEINETQADQFLHGEDIYLDEEKESINNKTNNKDNLNDINMLGDNKKTSRATNNNIPASEVSGGGEKKNIKNNMVVLKFKENLIGSGKLSQGRITNFVPKERRLKN
ncbi:MAG: hypothetical protein KKF56_02500 [Nanoarchaeota archaeon]|nr:hypothetical protein [Nanoarchaeota archaeon]